MKKIACVGYHCTGAGVIDDLLRECDNTIQSKYETEFRLAQDADGISDLEYYLVENPHRQNSGFALKRFLRYIKRYGRNHRKLFGKSYYTLAEEYVHTLAKFDYRGSCYIDYLMQPWYRIPQYWINRINDKIRKTIGCSRKLNFMPWVHDFHAICTEDEFLRATTEYIEKLCQLMNTNGAEYVVLDQFASPMNPSRYIRYAKDIKIIIVDRDPRDVYVNQKKVNEHVLPIDDINQYCEAFRNNRKIKGEIPRDVMYVKFEDMVLKYDEMVPKVLDFLGIDNRHHVAPKTHFDPVKSINGTQMWRKYPQYMDDVKIIEQKLPEFIYHYSK